MAVDTGFAGKRRGAGIRSRLHAGLPALRRRADALRHRPAALGTLAALVIVALLAVVALSRAGGYTSTDRANFVSGCLRNGGATRAQCGCMFDRITAALPHDAYAKATVSWSLRTSRVFSDAVAACAGTGPGGSSSPL